jgi:predicted mannosyl-3-phosphoglycerate phosphatase (HAD superfamily)
VSSQEVAEDKLPVQWEPSIMPTLRRTQTIYVTLDPFLSLRGKVLHNFEQLLTGLDEAEFPCIWLTSLTRAQLDEPRRRFGHNEPFIGESSCGVYLPEDYFHLKSGNTIRCGRFTCIPIAKPQPAAANALADLASDLRTSIVPLFSLSPRELSQNTGLPASEAEQIRMRDFDELFFFAGTSDSEIAKFADEAQLRGLTLQNLGTFWSLSCGADLGKCIHELGGLYDRALRAHAQRVAIAVKPSSKSPLAGSAEFQLETLSAACDRTLLLTERQPAAGRHFSADTSADTLESVTLETSHTGHGKRASLSFPLHSPQLWDEVLANLQSRK